MSKDKQVEQNELVKSLAEELDMSEEEILSLIEKSEEDELEKGGKMKKSDDKEKEGKEDVEVNVEVDKEKENDDEDDDKEDKEEKATKKSEEADLVKSIQDSMAKLKELRGAKSEPKSDDVIKSYFTEFNDDFKKSLEVFKGEVNEFITPLQEEIAEIKKSLDTIGENSQGQKGVRFNSFLEKSGDNSPMVKDGKTYLSSSDRDGISEAMLSVIEKSEDDSLKKSMSADLINYQGSNQLSKEAIVGLNQNGYYFKEQIRE